MAVAALLVAAPVAHAGVNYVQNGGFETGDFTGWTPPNDGGLSFVYGTDALYGPHSGSYEALLGSFGADGTLSQTISDTDDQYLMLTYWLASDGNTPNDFSALWNGNVINGSAITDDLAGYTKYTFDVIATGSDTLAFDERNDNGWLSLDDVSVTRVPEPGALAMFLMALLGVGTLGLRDKYF
jgi:hypothetical protein